MCEIKKEEYRICRKCNETLSINCFNENPKLKSGYDGLCHSCTKRYVKKGKPKVVNGHKVCTKCNETLPVDCFKKNPKLKSGYNGSCISCSNTYVKKLPSSEVVDGHKMCTKCNTLLPVDKFRKNLKVKSGLHSHCIDCCIPPKKIREPKVVTPKKVKPPRIIDGKCICRTCQMELPVDDFYKYKSGNVKIDCKKCTLKRNRENYRPDRYREYRKQYNKNKRDERRIIREQNKLIKKQEKEK